MNKILIIEDDSSLREALQTKLTSVGFSVTSVPNSEIGLQHVLDEKPDLIFLDVNTGGYHGSVFLDRLRSLPEGKNDSKVIVFTNLESAEVQKKVEAYGIEGYLIKAETSLEEIAQKTKEILQVKAS